MTDLTAYEVQPGVLNGLGGVTKESDLIQEGTSGVNLAYDRTGKSTYGGLILVVGSDTNDDKKLDVFRDISAKGLVFKVEGVSKIRVNVSDDKAVGENADGSTKYRSVNLDFSVTAGTPYVVIDAAKLLAANPDFNVKGISSVSFVIDQNTVEQKGTLKVTSKGLRAIPDFDTQTSGTLTNFTSYDVEPGEMDNSGIISKWNADTDSFEFEYKVTGNEFGGAILVIADDKKKKNDSGELVDGQDGYLESGFFNLENENLVFQYEAISNKKLPDEIEVTVTDSVTQKKADGTDILVDGKAQYRGARIRINLKPGQPFIVITKDMLKAALPDLVTSEITTISFVVTNKSEPAEGGIRFLGNGFTYVPDFEGQPYDPSVLTQLAGTPGISAFGGNTSDGKPEGTVDLEHPSLDEIRFEAHLPTDTSFSYAVVSTSYFDEAGVFQGTPFSFGNQLIFAAKGSEGNRVRVKVIDVNNKKVVFNLALQPYYQNFVLDLSPGKVPEGFQNTAIAQIIFDQDNNLVKSEQGNVMTLQLKGVKYEPPDYDTQGEQTRAAILKAGLGYFESGHGVDATSHLPYDRLDTAGNVPANAKTSQPGSIGYYLQLLAEVSMGRLTWTSKSKDQALAEINAVIAKLTEIQNSAVAWNGLLPTLDLSNPASISRLRGSDILFGDNANLTQSLATVVGTLRKYPFPADKQSLIDSIVAQIETFLDKQEVGYQRLVNSSTGFFARGLNLSTSQLLSGDIDYLLNEYRSAIAFLQVRYRGIPSSVWSSLKVFAPKNYTTSDGAVIENIPALYGSASEYFLPSLRSSERNFIGFSNVLTNAFLTHADYSARFNIPGFLASSNLIGGGESDQIGISELATSQELLISNIGSIYALAAAYSVNPGLPVVGKDTTVREAILTLLTAIRQQFPELVGTYGIMDSARSRSEVSGTYIATDVAATVLALSGYSLLGNAANDFDYYLSLKKLDKAYGELYDAKSQELEEIQWSDRKSPEAIKINEKTVSVFDRLSGEGSINGFPGSTTSLQGTKIVYNSLPAGSSGKSWSMSQSVDARGAEFSLLYSATKAPQKAKVVFLNAAGTKVFEQIITLAASAQLQNLTFNVSAEDALKDVKQVQLVFDNASGSASSGEFVISAMTFLGGQAPIDLKPDPRWKSFVYTLPQKPVITSSDGVTSVSTSAKGFVMNYDLSNSGSASTTLSFDSGHPGKGWDASTLVRIISGVSSASANQVKLAFHDGKGNTALFALTAVQAASQYYEIRFPEGFDKSNILSMEYIVDTSSVSDGGKTGSVEIELKGL